MKVPWKAVAPVVLTLVLALLPAPSGLPQHAWWYFAIFAGVVLALALEPLPGGAVGLLGVALVTVLGDLVLLSPDQLTKVGTRWPAESVRWALSGFSNPTVWLIFAAFMFALGYEKTGLGRRLALVLVRIMGRRTLALGYAVAVADLVLAPFTPSNTARSAGTIYPVIANLPPLYGSAPHDPSARRVGGFLMWTALAVTCVTSSMFPTALAPNLLALELARTTAGVNVTWMEWFVAASPLGLVLAGVPLLAYALYPPEIKISEETPRWADAQLRAMGPVSKREIAMAALAVVALVLWVFGGDRADPTTAALVVIGLMLIGRVVTWDDIVSNKNAWNTLAWFATLVTLASGLSQVGFVAWFADQVGARMAGVTPTAAMVLLVVIFFVSHYLFASITAHVTALLPVILTVGSTVPGLPMRQFTMLLLLSLGIMGVLTPYATGPSPVYYGSGFIPPAHYWRLGAVFGAIFLMALLMIGMGGTLASR